MQPKAILMKFQSIADTTVQDEYFYKCSRERIFEFHNYRTSNSWEVENLVSLLVNSFYTSNPLIHSWYSQALALNLIYI